MIEKKSLPEILLLQTGGSHLRIKIQHGCTLS